MTLIQRTNSTWRPVVTAGGLRCPCSVLFDKLGLLRMCGYQPTWTSFDQRNTGNYVHWVWREETQEGKFVCIDAGRSGEGFNV
jgi:hypothetical protein